MKHWKFEDEWTSLQSFLQNKDNHLPSSYIQPSLHAMVNVSKIKIGQAWKQSHVLSKLIKGVREKFGTSDHAPKHVPPEFNDFKLSNNHDNKLL